jgi:murein DD-endopeptidase MepM/ murein hydrolase activator NlpD
MVGLGWLSSSAEAQSTPTPSTAATTVPRVTTTTRPRSTTTAAPTTTTSTTAAPPATTPTTFPPGLLAIANSVKRTPPSNDSALMAALAPLQQLGMTAQQAMVAGMGQFPLAGPAYYSDDWLEPRPGNPPRLHEGDDIVAALGTPIRAPIDGVLKYDFSDPGGYGVAAIVTGPDKTFYLNGHLSATITGLATGSAVKQGQVIGLVGATGDATGPHDHFEVHPLGGAGVDPKPVLDAWQAAAIKAIPALVSSLKGEPSTTAAAVTPLQIALPAPQAAFSPSLPPLLTNSAKRHGSLAGLALAGLLALLASSGLAVRSLRPQWAVRPGLGGPREGPPTPAR